MKSVTIFLEEKRNEVDLLESHIEYLSTQKGNISIVLILKSSFILLLYNIIEATTTLLLENIHEKIGNIVYSELPVSLQKIYLEFYFDNRKKSEKLVNMKNILNEDATFPGYSEYLKRSKIFSGNIDGRKMIDIFKEYGISIDVKNIDVIKLRSFYEIKNKRCQLAHGEISFTDSCKNFTFQELKKLSTDVFNMLNYTVSCTESYLNAIKNK